MDKRIANIESDLSMIKYAVAKFEDDENIIDLCTRIICSACDAADVDSDTKYIILRSLKKLADDAKYPDTLCLHRKIVVHEHAYNKSNKKGKIDWNKIDAIPEDSYDYDEAPELTEKYLANAVVRRPKINDKEDI